MSGSPPWAGTLAGRGATALLPTYARYPVELAAGCGCRLVDSQGREYLDLVAGIAVNALGHAHPALVEAIRGAAEGLLHVSNLYWTEPMVRLAERLTAAAGMDRAFFCNSGAEAVEASIKLARKARPGRPAILCFERSFHGRTLGALSTTAQPRYQESFLPLLPGVRALPFGDPDAAREAIDERVALVLVEPIQGEGGMRPAPPGWLELLRDRCDATGALLVFDEVQSGLGRTGTVFAYQGVGVLPDAVTCAKALAGGLPMGALLARGAAAEAFQPGDHASTFGGGPLVSAAAHAVLDVILADGFLDELRRKGERLRVGLESLVAAHPIAAGVRGRGLMLGLRLTEPRAGEVVEALRERGALTCPAGTDVVRFVPPLVITGEEIDEALTLVGLALGDLEERRGRGMSGTAKARRQQAILDLVRAHPVGSQEELARGLARRGHAAAQSTLSRDLKELRILRVPMADGYRYLPAGEESRAPAASPALGGAAAVEVVGVDRNEVVVVVRTQVGRAQGVAVYLDGLRLPDVLATIAGDDTILVVPAGTARTAAVARRLRRLFGLVRP